MSKSPNLLFPALGVSALVLGVAFAIASRDYGASKIEGLQTRVGQVEAQASAASDKAALEAARADDLQAKIAQVQAEAQARLSSADLTEPAPQAAGPYNLGRPAHADEIAAWDVDVLPDGRGLPVGAGTVWDGEEVFVEKCAACHGDFAEGVDNWPVLAGGFDTLADEDPVKTVGSYWPYLSTVWDYVNRSMPFGEAGTLSVDETYAIVAYILYSNDMVDDDFELSNETFLDVEMHNADGFLVDDREAREYATWRGEPCMTACKDQVEVTMRSVFLVETPDEGGSNSMMNEAADQSLPSFTADGPSFVPAATAKAAPAPVQEAKVETVSADPLVEAGETLFRRCKSCHQVGEGAKNRSGPHLNGVVGRVMGSVDGFGYSAGFQAAMDAGRVWDEVELAAFLAAPKTYMSGTKMAFAGLKKKGDQEALVAYLNTFR